MRKTQLISKAEPIIKRIEPSLGVRYIKANDRGNDSADFFFECDGVPFSINLNGREFIMQCATETDQENLIRARVKTKLRVTA